jgi:hypothetical protein
MARIGGRQLEGFRQHQLQEFEDEMVDHFEEFAPRHWQVMGELDGRRAIRRGIEQSMKYGFTNHGSVRFYIELMFMFGSSFDTDPQHPWAIRILGAPGPLDQMTRADQLYSAMNDYLAQVSGPDHKYLKEAMERLSRVSIDDISRSGANLEGNLLRQLEFIYPEKCGYLGESVLRSMIQCGFRLAEDYSFTTEKGKVLMVALTFAVGHGFAHDPLYNWIQKRLEDSRRREPEKRIEQLHSKALIYLRHIVQQERA